MRNAELITEKSLARRFNANGREDRQFPANVEQSLAVWPSGYAMRPAEANQALDSTPDVLWRSGTKSLPGFLITKAGELVASVNAITVAGCGSGLNRHQSHFNSPLEIPSTKRY